MCQAETEMPECFICREEELQASDPLRKFCDCKNLLAHHMCLSTWIQTGRGSEDRLRCIACRAKYHLQKSSPWRALSFQWQTWFVLLAVLVLLGVVPYVVYLLMTAVRHPSPPTTFKLAAVAFGLLAEILLFKCLFSYLSGRYQLAEQSSFTVRARGVEEGGAVSTAAASAASVAVRHASSPASQTDGRKVDVLRSGYLNLF